jgi:hypothetical protein
MRADGAAAARGEQLPATDAADMIGATVDTGTEQQAGCGCGCNGSNKSCNESLDFSSSSMMNAPIRSSLRSRINGNSSRAASLSRRKALSSRGKAAISNKGMSAAQSARAANPQVSGRELAQHLREQRSSKGGALDKKTTATRPVRPPRNGKPGAAQDAPWKVGASETVHGQTLTGTMVGRSDKVTGDEPSTCREVTGTEYMGADIFRNFCQTEPGKNPRKVGVTSTSHGNRVSGNEVGRSSRVTGDEPGTCQRVTGVEYVGAEQAQNFCGSSSQPAPNKFTLAETRRGKSVTGNNVGRSDRLTGNESGAGRQLTGTQYMQPANGKAPAKVAATTTLRGGRVTGSELGRSERVTGDEPGSCRNVTGDDYISREQYSRFCSTTPQPKDRKVGVSKSPGGRAVSGTMTGRSERVTGDEPGTCKAITGTPYAGAEQYKNYCATDESALAAARARRQRSTPGAVMTGLQPGIGGAMTGAGKGACEPVSGTPYVGADQYAAVCPATPAQPGNGDFPQPLHEPAAAEAPWGQFSTRAPAHAAQTPAQHSAVTGTRYEQGKITGPFGMAGGRVTGTEEFRFGGGNGGALIDQPVQVTPVAAVDAASADARSRITGEGMGGTLKITGDDWDRGDRVTGTEGMSAVRRNPTRRGSSVASMATAQPTKRNEDLPEPVSKVTGGSGNTEKGSLVTYSGGARG